MKDFRIFAYAIEFYQGSKYLGNLIVDEPDREHMGYAGRKNLAYKGILKKGYKEVKLDGTYLTECVPLCGRIAGTKSIEI